MGSDFYALGRYASDLDALQAHLSADILKDAEFDAALNALKTTLEQIKTVGQHLMLELTWLNFAVTTTTLV